jgi:protoporphyrin/coproporphyrin ferrochelatase
MDAVLLLAHGTPDALESVPDFLRNVTGGRPIPEPVVKEIQHRYSLIGHSPLTEITHRQAQRLARLLDLPVYVGMRNWHPYIPDVVRQMSLDGVTRAVSICLAPQNSRTSVGLYRRALFGAESGSIESPYPPAGAPPPFAIEFVESWHDHPLLVRAFAERLAPGWTQASVELGAAAPIIFTAHSVPTRTVAAGDPYETQARETAARVAAEVAGLPQGNWRFAFQSQGMSGGAWLGPTVENTVLELKAAGHRGVFLQPVGFLADHVEILYDLDIFFRDFAEQQGLKFWRAPSLNDSVPLASALADIARGAFQRVPADVAETRAHRPSGHA